MNHRELRMESLITEELGQLLVRDLDLEIGVLATISYVDVSSDLSRAEVGISVIPSDRSDEVMKVLVKEQGEFQHKLNRKLNIKPMPRIEFKYDSGLEHAANIERLLK